jgi:hypothetical protein
MWKGKNQSMDNIKWERKRKTLTRKMKRSPEERHTRKLISCISAITHVILDQKRVNVCEHTVKLMPRDMMPSLPCVHINLLSSDEERSLKYIK